ncbi:MAG: hypothetical protein ACAI44_17500 [Candidatus Sericytochromatia bacterium]
MRKALKLLLAVMLTTGLIACQKVRVEDDPAEQAKATALAEKYVKAFAEGNGPLVLEMSTTPFWGDGEIVASQEELEAALKDQLKDVQELKFTVKEARYLPLSELKLMMPGLHERLVADKFTEEVHAVVLTLDVDGEQEQGLVLVKRLEDGMWRVVGIGD